jgi:hypothetical protein
VLQIQHDGQISKTSSPLVRNLAPCFVGQITTGNRPSPRLEEGMLRDRSCLLLANGLEKLEKSRSSEISKM